jgi:hypothetical protein
VTVSTASDSFTIHGSENSEIFWQLGAKLLPAREAITNIYNSVLHRGPDERGLYWYLSRVESREWTLFDVYRLISESEEAQAI